MYGLSKDVDLAFLKGKELHQVCTGANEVILHFDDYIAITIMSECDYKSKIGEIVRIERYPTSSSLICQLLGSSITEAQGKDDGTLVLEFANGDALTLYDDSKEYESYQIKHGEQLIVV
jgi:hypothetical protein